MLTSVLTKAEGTWRALCDRLPPALAICLGVVRADPEYAGRLRTAQIAAIVRLTPLTVSASCLNASILLLTFRRMGLLGPSLWIWCSLVFAAALYYGRNWMLSRPRGSRRQVTVKTIQRAIVHGGLFGGLWGAMPVLAFPGRSAGSKRNC